MNRRIVLFDCLETNEAPLRGLGLGNEVYDINALSVDPKAKEILTIGNGDGVMLIGKSPFVFLQQLYHFGIRNENFADCAIIDRVSIEGGAFVKVTVDYPTAEQIKYFMDEEFCKHKTWNFKQKILHTFDESMKFLNWLWNLPESTPIGLDYEASGMPLDKWFELSGASLGTIEYGGFISFTDLRHTCTSEQYQEVLDRLGQVLVKRQKNCWVYNMQYEFQVSHRMLGVTLYDLCDASVFNTLDGFHLKKYSLKWTANRVLKSTVWDSHFDRISELIDKMLFEEVGKLKRDKQKVLKVTKDDFDKTPEWKELISIYPTYESEFRSLILEYWGNPFMCIPAEILGYYCNLDMFYTLMIAVTASQDYSADAISTFLDNNRLGCLLHSSGLYIDENLRVQYHNVGIRMMAWGITYCAEARCMINMNKLKSTMANINKYTPIAQKLLKVNKFFSGDTLEITKYLLLSNIDTMDAYPLGLNEGNLVMTYGLDFATKFIEVVRNAMIDVKMIKTPRATKANPNPVTFVAMKIDASVERKRKILEIIAENIKPLLGLDKFKPGLKHNDLETYMKYEGVYEELMKVTNKQLYDINNIPDTIYFQGQTFDLEAYSNYISDNYFKCKSPIENDEICLELAKDYRAESAYLAAIFESTQQLNGADKFYQNLNITNPEDAFVHFMKHWETYEKSGRNPNSLGDYPEKIYTLALQFYNDLGNDVVKETWDNFNGYIAQEQFFPSLSSHDLCINGYEKVFDPSDLNNKFFFMRKFVINYLLYKKYSKVLSTYIDGMFKKNNIFVIEGKDHIPLRIADPNEPGAVEKCMVHYEVNTKSSKRWSSGFHTIISHADLKDCITTPPAYYTDPRTGEVIRDCDYILTYFDISSAEVKAAGFASGDPDLIDKFRRGIDIYIYTAKLYLSNWDQLDKKQQKKWRKRFKTVFLGVLYGLGRRSLAERLNCSEAEADNIIESLYKAFPKLREYVASQQVYPLQHGGYINTMLGDKLKVAEYELYLKATNFRERNNLEARIKRLGVNLPIQGGTSSIMACGFYNNIRESVNQGWENPLQPIIVVHDSNTNYVPVRELFNIRKFYDKYYTEFCASFGPKIVLLFDLLAGTAYESAMEMKMIDDNTIEFTGSALSMLSMYDKLINTKDISISCNVKREDLIPNWVTSPVERFIIEKGTCIRKDLSKYTVQFHKN